MNGKSKFTRHQQQQHQEAKQTESIEAHAHQRQEQREFAGVEEIIRFDAAQTPVPGAVAERLQESVEREHLQGPRPWWKRIFG